MVITLLYENYVKFFSVIKVSKSRLMLTLQHAKTEKQNKTKIRKRVLIPLFVFLNTAFCKSVKQIVIKMNVSDTLHVNAKFAITCDKPVKKLSENYYFFKST